MGEELRICHMIGSLQFGGAERQFVNIVNNLSCKSKTVILMRTIQPGGFLPFLDKDISPHTINLKRGRFFPIYIFRLVRLLKRLKIDVLHTHMFWPNFYGALAARITGIPVFVTTEHGQDYQGEWNVLYYWAERFISRVAKMRICVSDDILQIRRDVMGTPSNKLIYIPNGTIIPGQKERSINEPIIIGTLGRFVKEKDFITLLKAASIVRDHKYKFYLYIIGDGPERQNIEDEIEKHNLQDIIELTGFQKNTQAWLEKITIFAMSSISEGQPLALLEAMANELAIVATKVGGIQKTVQDGREAILVSSGDPAALAHALETFMNDRSMIKEYGSNARQRVIQEFSIKMVCKRHMKLYCELYNKDRD